MSSFFYLGNNETIETSMSNIDIDGDNIISNIYITNNKLDLINSNIALMNDKITVCDTDNINTSIDDTNITSNINITNTKLDTVITNTNDIATETTLATTNTKLDTVITNTNDVATDTTLTTTNTKLDTVITNTNDVATDTTLTTTNTKLDTVISNTNDNASQTTQTDIKNLLQFLKDDIFMSPRYQNTQGNCYFISDNPYTSGGKTYYVNNYLANHTLIIYNISYGVGYVESTPDRGQIKYGIGSSFTARNAATVNKLNYTSPGITDARYAGYNNSSVGSVFGISQGIKTLILESGSTDTNFLEDKNDWIILTQLNSGFWFEVYEYNNSTPYFPLYVAWMYIPTADIPDDWK
jgi:hypothetical protein